MRTVLGLSILILLLFPISGEAAESTLEFRVSVDIETASINLGDDPLGGSVGFDGGFFEEDVKLKLKEQDIGGAIDIEALWVGEYQKAIKYEGKQFLISVYVSKTKPLQGDASNYYVQVSQNGKEQLSLNAKEFSGISDVAARGFRLQSAKKLITPTIRLEFNKSQK